jgi:hypothetical protein
MPEDDASTAAADNAFTPAKPAPARVEDLSAEISRTVEKKPGDEVRCTRVSQDRYRCNWWSQQATAGYDNPAMGGLLVTTHRVRQSRFLLVTRRDGKLVIQDVPRGQ